MPGSPIFTAVLLAAASLALLPRNAASQGPCKASRLPVEMPAVDAIVDSAAITALITGSGARGVLRFSIVADGSGPPRVYPIAGGAAAPALEWMTPRIEAALRPARKSSIAWGVRLIATADPAPAIVLERSEYCRAQSIPSATPATIQIVRRADDPTLQFPAYSIRINSAGQVRGITFLRSSGRDIETQIRRAVNTMRYHPARIDGVPVASVDTIGLR